MLAVRADLAQHGSPILHNARNTSSNNSVVNSCFHIKLQKNVLKKLSCIKLYQSKITDTWQKINEIK